MTNNHDVAASWLQGLAARGITTRLVNGRIRHFPASAYRSLTDAEIITLRHHRAEIKAAINAGVSFDVVPAAPAVERGTPEPAPGAPAPTPAPPCAYCHQSPCVGPAHHAFDVLHWNDPVEIKRRNEDEADQYEAWRRGWPTARMIERAAAREAPETDEQKQQRAIRQNLGWESPGGTRKI